MRRKPAYFDVPHLFVRPGQRVRAKITVYESPGADYQPIPGRGPEGAQIHAEPGDLGTVVHLEPGAWPTVRFDRTGTATMVTSDEIELVALGDRPLSEEQLDVVVRANVYATLHVSGRFSDAAIHIKALLAIIEHLVEPSTVLLEADRLLSSVASEGVHAYSPGRFMHHEGKDLKLTLALNPAELYEKLCKAQGEDIVNVVICAQDSTVENCKRYLKEKLHLTDEQVVAEAICVYAAIQSSGVSHVVDPKTQKVVPAFKIMLASIKGFGG